MLTFYHAPGSSSMAAHIALHEVGASFESRVVSFSRKEQRSPEFLAINPEGKVPVLVIEGRVLTEVAGQEVTTLKRHLRAAHDMTPEQYRAKWDLPAHYPMVAPEYAKLRTKDPSPIN